MVTDIKEILQGQNIEFKYSGQDYLIRCLNPEHDDNNPSLRIDRHSGVYHCLSCGFKGNIYEYFGLLTTGRIAVKLNHLLNTLNNIKAMTEKVMLPPDAQSWDTELRGLSKETIEHFGLFKTSSDASLLGRVCIPLYDINGELVAFTTRHTLSDAEPKYLTLPRHSVLPVYPAVLPSGFTSMVLVEGPFDMLNLWDKGIKNVVASLGTTTLIKNAAEKLFPFKALGIFNIYLMFDGDTPGRSAANKLKNVLIKNGFGVEIIELEDGDDPGSLSQEQVDLIKRFIK